MQLLTRALLLAMSLLLLAAFPVAAQSDDEGWLLTSEDDSVLIATQQDVAVGPDESIDGLVLLDGTAVIEGSVEGILAVESDVTISGPTAQVERIFTISGSLTVADGAAVEEVFYTGTDVTGVDETLVTGDVVNAQEELVGALAAVVAVLIVVLIFVLIGGVIALLAMTLLVIAFGTDQVRRAGSMISNDVLKTIVVGLLMLVIPSIVITILFVTIVGIPLAIVLALAWGVVVLLGHIVVATWIGERILPRGRAASRPYGSAFLGMLILILLWWTGIVPLLAGIFGTGAVTLAGWRMLRGGGTPPVPPGYGDQWGQPMQVAPPPYAPPPYAPPPPPQGNWPPQGGPPQGGQPPSSWPQG